MRVLLRCQKDYFDSEYSDEYERDFSESEQPEEATQPSPQDAPLSPRASEQIISPSQPEQVTAVELPEAIPNCRFGETTAKKRPRSPPDSKPAATVMTGGGGRVRRHRSNVLLRENDSDEELLENEPPPLYNHHPISIRPAVAPEEEEEEVVEVEPKKTDLSPSALHFQQVLKKERGLEIVEQQGDGNCLFRAVSLQVYGDASMHAEIRERCLDFMERDPEHFAPFVDGDFAAYIARKRRLGVHGNNPEIQAMSELFNRPVEVFTPDRGAEPLNIFQTTYKTKDTPIRVSYHDGNHYNAVIDPLVPTAGLGLGLPGLQPGLADKLQLAKAVVESDHLADEIELQKVIAASKDDELQRAIKESSAFVKQIYDPADYVTNSGTGDEDFDLEQKVLMQSLEEYRRQEQGQKQRATSSSPTESNNLARLPEVATDPVASLAASATGVASIPPAASRPADEYPPTVQELVMNGFELRKVVHAYELIGDDFDDLLAFLMSNS